MDNYATFKLIIDAYQSSNTTQYFLGSSVGRDEKERIITDIINKHNNQESENIQLMRNIQDAMLTLHSYRHLLDMEVAKKTKAGNGLTNKEKANLEEELQMIGGLSANIDELIEFS